MNLTLMAATIYTTTAAADLEFGMTDETGIILESWSRNVQSVVAEVRDATNDVVAVGLSGITADITLDGYVNGTVTMNVAATLSLSNDTTTSGLTGGTIIIKSISESIAKGDFKKISVSATQYGSTMTV